MKKMIIITAALLFTGCSLTPTNPFDYFAGSEGKMEYSSTAHDGKRYDYGKDNESYPDDFDYNNETDSVYETDVNNDSILLPNPGAYLNTSGELESDIYSVNGKGEYYCIIYALSSGEGDNADTIAYGWSLKSAGYSHEFVQRDGYGEYLIKGNGIEAYLEVYSDRWKLYYPTDCELKSYSDSSEDIKDWNFEGFQNDTFGISVDPDETAADGVCVFCEGKKICRFCKGTHQVYVDIVTGWVDCTSCIDGSCIHCNGTGVDMY